MDDIFDSESDLSVQFPDHMRDSGSESPPAETRRRRRKKRPQGNLDFLAKCFEDLYELCGDILGEGAGSSVQVCRERSTGKEYAVKIVHPQSPDHRRRLLKEVEILHVCRKQPYILELKEYFETTDCFYMVYQKMEGGPLLQHISRGHFSEAVAREVVREIAMGLNFLHNKGIAHRDLKPANVLCERMNCVTPIRICDFDLGSNLESYGSPVVTTPELLTPVGSCEFMAPEVVAAFGNDQLTYDKKCDMWSLGVILYIMLCGRPPFYGNCGRDCDWDNGGTCRDCQDMLLDSIRQGSYTLEGREWQLVSDDAKDLISHLLVCDSRSRYTTEKVLNHRWILQEASTTPLPTPGVLHRSLSSQTPCILEDFTATAMSAQRLISLDDGMSRPMKHSRSEIYQSELYGPKELDDSPSPPYDSGFSDADSLLLSPPGSSALARRRHLTSFSTPIKCS